MRTSFFTDPGNHDYYELMGLFESEIEEFEARFKIDDEFTDSFKRNRAVFHQVIRDDKLAALFKLGKSLLELVQPFIISKNKYHVNKRSVFQPYDIKFIEHFRITNKSIFDDFDNPPYEINTENQIPQKQYFKRMLSFTTLVAHAFGLYLVNRPGAALDLAFSSNSAYAFRTEYYLFYNRSHIDKMDLGIGKVILEKNTAYVYYYYKSTEPDRAYDTLLTIGKFRNYNKASVLVLYDLMDDGKEGFYKSDEAVESHYVFKNFKQQGEKILLGVISTWNRNKSYPVSSAVVMIESKYYDEYTGKIAKDHVFNIKEMLENKNFLPRIFYYLYNQSVTLESVIDANTNSATGAIMPFSSLDDIPFYKSEAKLLEKIAGEYRGLSILPIYEHHIVIVSKMVISPTGIVQINTFTKDEPAPVTPEDSKGFVKLIEVDKSLRGRVFISLQHNFAKHYNSLNHYLEFQMKDQDTPSDYLKGAFAGRSLVTDQCVAATVVFEKVSANDHFEPVKFHINEKDGTGIDKLIELYNRYYSLFRFYDVECDSFTNSKGVQLLRKILPLYQSGHVRVREKKQYEVFISIPLSSSKSTDEYVRNSNLVSMLKKDIAAEFNIDPEKIYCACFNGNERLDYDQYLANNRTAVYDDIKQKIEAIKTFILLYPKRLNSEQTIISSALVEAGFALALNKTVMLFVDAEEEPNLPGNLKNLCHNSSFNFVTRENNPFSKMFSMDNNFDRISKLLMRERYSL